MSASHSDIARRYALAFFELARDGGQIDAVEKDLQTLVALMAQSPDFVNFSANTTLTRGSQAQAANVVGEHLGLSALTRKFIGTVATNRRLADMSGIAQAALDMIAAQKGETTATVVSAAVLDDAQTKQLTAQLNKLTGLKVRLNAQVDPALIGGLVVRVGALRIDDSVKTKLERLHRALASQTTTASDKQMKEVA